MSSSAPSIARASHNHWLELRARAESRLREGRGDGADAHALARIVRRELGDVGQGDWSDIGVRVVGRRFNGSGMLRRTDWPIEVVVSTSEDGRRRRFTVAHEICHYLLRGSERLVAPSAIELFCDAFAAELLVPQSRLDALRTASGELPTAEELVHLANRLKVNFSPVLFKLPFYSTSEPSFALVAAPSPATGELQVDVSSGTGGMGGIPEGRHLAKLVTGLAGLKENHKGRISNIDRIDTDFIFPPTIAPRDRTNNVIVPRSGRVVGTARWNGYQLNNGRLVLVATFAVGYRLRLYAPVAEKRSRSRR